MVQLNDETDDSVQTQYEYDEFEYVIIYCIMMRLIDGSQDIS